MIETDVVGVAVIVYRRQLSIGVDYKGVDVAGSIVPIPFAMQDKHRKRK